LALIATDPKARRTPYPVGSAAWIQLLADGGLEDISDLWHGVDRESSGSVKAPAAASQGTEPAP
jgi:hypothetical protein